MVFQTRARYQITKAVNDGTKIHVLGNDILQVARDTFTKAHVLRRNACNCMSLLRYAFTDRERGGIDNGVDKVEHKMDGTVSDENDENVSLLQW